MHKLKESNEAQELDKLQIIFNCWGSNQVQQANLRCRWSIQIADAFEKAGFAVDRKSSY